MTLSRSDILHGTLDLLVLKTLDTMGSMHGYGLAQRLSQITDGALALNQGTLYPALLRLQQRGWISAAWGASDNNRRARFYAITRAGRRQLAKEAEQWARASGLVNRLLLLPPEA